MNKKNIIFSAIIFSALIFNGCFSSWMPDNNGKGTITINLGSSNIDGAAGINSRSALPPWPPLTHGFLENIEYEITLSSENETIPTFTARGGDKISRVVNAGYWNIKIDAFLENKVTDFSPEGERIYYATGSDGIMVIEGQENPKDIQMFPICQKCENYPCDCIPSYTIIFAANGGSGEMDPVVYYIDTEYQLPENEFIKTEHAFISWNTEANGEGTSFANKATVFNISDKDGDTVTLYAIWLSDAYTVVFHANGGDGNMDNEVYLINETITLPEFDFIRTGYIFTSWNTQADGMGISYDDGEDLNVTTSGIIINLYAQWTAIPYIISFSANGGEGGQSSTVTATYGEPMPSINTAPVRTDYYFAGYFDTDGIIYYNRDLSSARYWDKTEDTTLNAQWTLIPVYTITFHSNDGTNRTDTQSSYENTTITLILNSFGRTGYNFSGWAATPTGAVTSANGASFNVVTSNVNLYARWAARQFQVTFITMEGNGGPQQPVTVTYDQPMPNAGPVPTRTGFVFSGYYDQPTGGNIYYSQNNTALVSTRNWDKTIDTPLFAQWTSGFKSVSAGNRHTVGIRPDGSLWAWGNNGDWRLGDGTLSERRDPTKIGTDIDWEFVSAGDNHTVAIKTDGSLWTWGGNNRGQLGHTMSPNVPARVGTDTWAFVSAGLNYTIAIKTNGTMWAWGDNDRGQLGITTMNNNAPTQIGTDTNWAFVSASVSIASPHTLAIKTDGTLWAWGGNSFGQLGIVGDRNVPTQVGTDTDWASASASNMYSLAIKTGGTLWAWGRNNNSQLGDGGQQRSIPSQVGSDTNWASVSTSRSTSESYTVAIKTDGTLWGWGSNRDGQLGDNTTMDRYVPTRIGMDTDWVYISAGDSHTVAIKTNHRLWVWGMNNYRQLGDGGTSQQRSTPFQITP